MIRWSLWGVIFIEWIAPKTIHIKLLNGLTVNAHQKVRCPLLYIVLMWLFRLSNHTQVIANQVKSPGYIVQVKPQELSTHQITENNDLRIARGGAAIISSVMVSIITMNRNGLSAEPCCKPTSILTAVPAVVFTDVVQSSYISLISSTYTSGTPALCRQYQIRFTRLSYLHYVPEPSSYYPLPEF